VSLLLGGKEAMICFKDIIQLEYGWDR